MSLSGNPKIALVLPALIPALMTVLLAGLGIHIEMKLGNIWKLRAKAALKLSFPKESGGLEHEDSDWG